MPTENEALVRRGYDALASGDLGLLRSLMAPDLIWEGREPGTACHSREEAMAIIEARQEERAFGEIREVTEIDADVVLVVMGLPGIATIDPVTWGLPEGHEEIASLVTVRDGKVMAMKGYLGKAEARAALEE